MTDCRRQFLSSTITTACILLLFLSNHPTNAKKIKLTWVNGIGHNLDHMNDGSVSISSLFHNTKVEFCHNPTSMTSEEDYLGYVGDLTQAGSQKLGRITSEVDALVSHLRRALLKVGPKGRVIHIAHSQGALITLLACNQLSLPELRRMEVISFGGAVALRRSSDKYPFARCVNYYSINDPILYLVPSAAQALKSGFFAGGGDSSEFVFLTPRMGDPILDHSLMQPTYAEALKWEGDRFWLVHRSLPRRMWVEMSEVLVWVWTDFIMEHIVMPFVELVVAPIVEWSKPYLVVVADWLREYIILPLVRILVFIYMESLVAYHKWKYGQEGERRFYPAEKDVVHT